MQVVSDRKGTVGNGDRVGIIKAGEAVLAAPVAGKELSAYALKTLLLLFQAAGADAWRDGVTHRISKGELHDLHAGHAERIARTLRELGTTEITVSATSSRGEPADLTQPYLSKRTIERRQTRGAWVEYQFSDALRFVLQNSDHWAEIDKLTALSLRSIYAVKLYEVGEMFWKRKKGRAPTTWTLTVEELREQMGIKPGRYTNWSDLERRVLRDASAELEQLSPFTISWSVERLGKRVAKVHIRFDRKPDGEATAAAQERERHSAGRLARREQTVETVEGPQLAGEQAEATPTVRRYNRLRAQEARKHRGPEPRRTAVSEGLRLALKALDAGEAIPGATGKMSDFTASLSLREQPDNALDRQADLFKLDDDTAAMARAFAERASSVPTEDDLPPEHRRKKP